MELNKVVNRFLGGRMKKGGRDSKILHTLERLYETMPNKTDCVCEALFSLAKEGELFTAQELTRRASLAFGGEIGDGTAMRLARKLRQAKDWDFRCVSRHDSTYEFVGCCKLPQEGEPNKMGKR